MKRWFGILIIAVLVTGWQCRPPAPRHAVLNTPCPFQAEKLRFEGSPVEQARCLLRPVYPYGRLGRPLHPLPDPLEKLIGTPVTFSVAQFRRYLSRIGVSEADLGGNLDSALCRANDNDPKAPIAEYFLIHDTSTPNYGNQAIPDNINTPAWPHNNLQRWDQGEKAKAHIFINRLGQSLTAVDFGTPWRATKLEVRVLGERSRGMAVHVELIQPRRSDPNGPPGNDAIAPVPGFTDAQLKRLALVYIAASLRKGRWMIPAYHAAFDAGIPDAHDDPQHFDLRRWAQFLKQTIGEIQQIQES